MRLLIISDLNGNRAAVEAIQERRCCSRWGRS
jgi:hypothetical protein